MDLAFRAKKVQRRVAGKKATIVYEVESDIPLSKRRKILNNADFSDLLTDAVLVLRENNPAEGVIITLEEGLPSKYVDEVQEVFRRYSKATGVKVSYQ